MFTNKILRGKWGECNSTPGSKLSQGYSILGKYLHIYRHTKCYSFHHYGNFADQFPVKQPKEINFAMIGVMMMQNSDMIKKSA